MIPKRDYDVDEIEKTINSHDYALLDKDTFGETYWPLRIQCNKCNDICRYHPGMGDAISKCYSCKCLIKHAQLEQLDYQRQLKEQNREQRKIDKENSKRPKIDFVRLIPQKLGEKNLTLESVYTKMSEPIKVRCNKCNYCWSGRCSEFFYRKYKSAICPKCRGKNVLSPEDIRNRLTENNWNCADDLSQPLHQYNITCKICGYSKILSHKKLKLKKQLLCSSCGSKGLPLQRTGITYRITFPNDKCYIGQTMRRLAERKHQYKDQCFHESRVGYDLKISCAIRKYGWDNLRWDILHVGVPIDKLDEMEIQEIAKHDSYNNGYNSTEGGQNTFQRNDVTKRTVALYLARQKQEEQKKQIQDQRELRKIEKEKRKQIKLFLREQKVQEREAYLEQESEHRSQGAKKKYILNAPKSSKYRGVCLDKQHNKYKANIKFQGKKIHIGLFATEEAAARAYDEMAKKLRGNNAVLNFP